jgi:hypothetical protein
MTLTGPYLKGLLPYIYTGDVCIWYLCAQVIQETTGSQRRSATLSRGDAGFPIYRSR